MSKLISSLIALHSIALLLLGIYFLLMILAGGHMIDFSDFGELKFILEIVVYVTTAFYLLARRKKFQSQFEWVALVLLILVQVAFLDFYFEISSVEYDDNGPIGFFILFGLLFTSNLFLIYMQFKGLMNNRNLVSDEKQKPA